MTQIKIIKDDNDNDGVNGDHHSNEDDGEADDGQKTCGCTMNSFPKSSSNKSFQCKLGFDYLQI